MKPAYRLKEIKIELTNRCPLNCLHCSSESTPHKQVKLSKNVVGSLLRESRAMGAEEVVFSGGEPLIYPDIEEVVALCDRLKLRACLYTTGIDALDLDDVSPRTLPALKKLGLDKAVFSIYSDKSEIHDRITRVNGSLESTLCAIKIALRCGLETGLHFVPLKENMDSLGAVVNLAKDYGIKKLSVLRFVPQGRGALVDIRSSLGEIQNLWLKNEISLVRKDSTVQIRLGSPYNILLLEEDVDCRAAVDRIFVTPDGNIHPCDAFKQINSEDVEIDDAYGSIVAHPLSEVWQKSTYLAAVRKYLSTPFVQPCKACDLLARCKSGCLAQKVIRNGSFKKDRDPDCLLQGGEK